jgi:hypothetical protein
MSTKLPLLLVLLAAAVLGGDGKGTRLDSAARAEAQVVVAPQLTAAILKGTCGFNAVSTDVVRLSPAFLHPAASFGTLQFDGVSAVTGTVTINASGKVVTPAPATGSYSVNATDGRTGTIDFSASGGAIYTFVIVNAGAAIRYINTGPVDPKTGIVDAVTIATCKF